MGDRQRRAAIDALKAAGERVWSLGEFVDADFPKPEFLIEGLLLEQAIHSWHGPAGAGKTWLALEAALSIAGGRDFLGHFPTGAHPRRVLIIDQESHPGQLADRLRQLLRDDPTADTARQHIGIVVPSGLTVDSDPENPASGYNILRGFIEAHKPELIILDSFTRIHAGTENDAGSMADVNARIRTLRDEFGCAVLIIDHVTKIPAESAGSNPGVRLRGSTEKLAAIDAGMLIERGMDGIVCDPSSKARYTEALPPFTVELVTTERGGLALRYGAEKKKEEASTARDVMMAIHELEAQTGREGATAVELAGYLGVSQSTVTRHCNVLLKSSLLITAARPTTQKGGRPARAYTVPREREETVTEPAQEPLEGVIRRFPSGDEYLIGT